MAENWHFTHVAKFKRRKGLDAFLDVADGLAGGTIGARPRRGGVLGMLFFEASTRTRMSFVGAAGRLGMTVNDLGGDGVSSKAKGESDEDTVLNVAQYCDAVVLRHPDDWFASKMAEEVSTPIICGGAGTRSHPTQALLDLLTVRQCQRRLDNLSWVICGDIKRGRTVKSLLALLRLCEGVRVTLVSPANLALDDVDLTHARMRMDVRVVPCLAEACHGADVVYMTRLQKERTLLCSDGEEALTPDSYADCFRMTKDCLKNLPSDGIVMHPGPCGPEITDECRADGRNVILKQARNGMFVRQALLDAVVARDQREWWSWFGDS